jgi:hypothetical protein
MFTEIPSYTADNGFELHMYVTGRTKESQRRVIDIVTEGNKKQKGIQPSMSI